jgi:hypothetical protein
MQSGGAWALALSVDKTDTVNMAETAQVNLSEVAHDSSSCVDCYVAVRATDRGGGGSRLLNKVPYLRAAFEPPILVRRDLRHAILHREQVNGRVRA